MKFRFDLSIFYFCFITLMSQPVTSDNIDDLVRSALKVQLDEIANRIKMIEQVVREDLVTDKNQVGVNESSMKLDSVYLKIDELKAELFGMKDELRQIKEQLAFLIQTLTQQNR
jgi:hypothetical protein